MTTPTPNRNEAAEYNYPSIEHNGEQWIRLVDYINLTEIERQQAVAEFAREVVDAGKIHGGWRDHHWYEAIRTIAKERGIDLTN